MSRAAKWMALVVCVVIHGLLEIALADSLPESNTELAKLVISVTEASPEIEAANAALAKALTGIVPENQTAPTIAKAGGFVLWGDIFKTGGCLALADLPDWGGFAFTEWKNGAWTLRGLWKIPTFWRPAEWTADGDEYLPIKPATEPFMLENLSDDRVPELIVAGSVDRYYQDHYLFRFSPKTNTLDLLVYAMSKPERTDDYVRLYFNSGRRAVFEEWQFLKWKDDKLIPVASWHEEVGYDDNNPTFVEGERKTAEGTSEVIRILKGNGPEGFADFYQLSRDGKPFGKLRVEWKDTSRFDEATENAWLFEKITRLPRALYPAHPDGKKIYKLEDLVTVKIEGDAEAAEKFKPRK